jgi:hypothetical protein
MAPSSKKIPWSVVAVGVVFSMVMALPRFARAADLGDEPSKSDSPSAQGEDSEKPKDSILDKKPADAAVASKKSEANHPPFWENKWFWAVAGGVAVFAVIAILTVPPLIHQANGGDVRPCNMSFVGCFGEGQ